jgi:hypothetical protein
MATSAAIGADPDAGGWAELVLPARILAVNGSTVSPPGASLLGAKRFKRGASFGWLVEVGTAPCVRRALFNSRRTDNGVGPKWNSE